MKLTTAVLVLFAAAITACSPVGARHTPQGAANGLKISSYPILEVRPFTTAEGYKGFMEHVAKVREVLLRYLPEEKLFEEISPGEKAGVSSGVLVLHANLTRAKSVTRTGRIMLGVMMGRSGMEMEVSLTDKSNGSQLAKELILVQSKQSLGVAGGTNREVINHMAREIINFLEKHQ